MGRRDAALLLAFMWLGSFPSTVLAGDEIPSTEAARAAVERYRQDPFSEEGRAAGLEASRYGLESPELTVYIVPEGTPWVGKVADEDTAKVLTTAWMVGMVGFDLANPTVPDGSADQFCAAYDQLFSVYGTLRQQGREAVAEVDGLLVLQEQGQLPDFCAGLSEQVQLEQSDLTAKDYGKVDRAIGLMDAGKLKRAIRIMERLHRKYPDDFTVLHELAYAYRAAGRSADAVMVLAPHEARLPEDTLSAYCSALDESGRNEEAQAATRRALERYPNSGLLHSTLGTTLVIGGKNVEALEAYTSGMRVEPTWPSNYLRATQLSLEMENPAMAIVWGETFCHLEGDRCTQALAVIDQLYAERVHLQVAKDGTVSADADLAAGPSIIENGPDGASMDLPHAIELATVVGGAAALAAPPSLARIHALRVGMLSYDAMGSDVSGFNVELLTWLVDLKDAGHLEAYDYILFSELYPGESMAYQDQHGAEVEAMMRYIERHPFTPTRAVLPTDRVTVVLPPSMQAPTEAPPAP